MPSKTIRISDTSRNILRELATREGESMQTILEKAIEDYRRRRFLEEVNKAYTTLRQNHEAWEEVEKERAEWDITLRDGLESGEEWTEDGKAISKGKRMKRR